MYGRENGEGICTSKQETATLEANYPYIDANWNEKYKGLMQMRQMNFLVCYIGKSSTANTIEPIIIPLT